MKAEAGKKKVVLELGGNAGAMVNESADLDWAVERLVFGSFAYAGQVCISVQRIYVVARLRRVRATFRPAGAPVQVGDPLDPDTELGRWSTERGRSHPALGDRCDADGARALVPGKPDGRWYGPTVLVKVPVDAMICSEEAFAPVVNLSPVNSFDAALGQINDSRFGLQCGVFTTSLDRTSPPTTSWRSAASL